MFGGKLMKAQINLITIWTNNIQSMKDFYSEVLGFEVIDDSGSYIEFKNEGVRFAICDRKIMEDYSDQYMIESKGQIFELAFPCETPDEVDTTYKRLVELGAKHINEPKNMPWNQRTALFADPDGNIHEIFASL